MKISGRLALTIALCTLPFATIYAQTTAPEPPSQVEYTHPHHQESRKQSEAEHNPACQNILTACKSAGFIAGQWKEDNGLWKDCFGPIMKGASTLTREGKSVTVSVNPSDVQMCKATHPNNKRHSTTPAQ